MLNDLDLYDQIADKIKETILFDQEAEALEGAEAISKMVESKNYRSNNPELSQGYEKIINQLQWVALPLLKKEEVLGLFSSQLALIFEMEDFDLKSKFKRFLLSNMLLEERDAFKIMIRGLIAKSQALVTSKKMQDGTKPTVANWIKNYVSYLGNKSADTIKVSQFYVENKDYNALSEAEKIKVKNLFNFYERLSYSSLTPDGIEETIPLNNAEFKGYLQDGKLISTERLDPHLEKILEISKNVLNSINESAAQAKAAAQQETVAPEIAAQINDVHLKKMYSLRDQYPANSPARRVLDKKIKELESQSGKAAKAPDNVSKPVDNTLTKTVAKKIVTKPEPVAQKTAANNNDEHLKSLYGLRDQYPVGSLERRALEEEIGKLSRKS